MVESLGKDPSAWSKNGVALRVTSLGRVIYTNLPPPSPYHCTEQVTTQFLASQRSYGMAARRLSARSWLRLWKRPGLRCLILCLELRRSHGPNHDQWSNEVGSLESGLCFGCIARSQGLPTLDWCSLHIFRLILNEIVRKIEAWTSVF